MRNVSRHCWCGARRAQIVVRAIAPATGRRHDLVRCVRCGVHQLLPQPTDEELAAAYSTEYYGASPRKFIGPVAALVSLFQGGRARLVERHLDDRNASLLDIGCGNGGFLAQLRERGFDHVEGTEWTSASAARVPADIPVHVGELTTLGLPTASYDVVTLWHVFEHLAEPDKTLREIHRLLRPGGYLFLSLPNQESRQAELFGKHWFHLDPPRHLYGFGPRSLRRLLRRESFSTLAWHTWSMEQNPYGWLQSVLNQRCTERDRAYNVLKGTAEVSRLERIADLTRVATLALPALAISAMESATGRGATMTLVARRDV